jgi:hypothetical protein
VPLRYGWTLTRQYWESFTAAFASQATSPWRRVHLEDVNRDSVPSCPGIYAICAPVARSHQGFPPRLDNVVYVGKATALKARFMNHCRDPTPEMQRAKSCFRFQLDFWFIECRPDAIAELESLLIECLGPSVNRVGGAITATIRPIPQSP